MASALELIIHLERLQASGYFRAKIAQENLIKSSSIPYSIVRATQFFEFIKGIADFSTEGNTVRLPTARWGVDTVEALAEALLDYQGTVIFTSHDRHFMKRVATCIVEVRDGHVTNYRGDYEASREVSTFGAPRRLFTFDRRARVVARKRARRPVAHAFDGLDESAHVRPTRVVLYGRARGREVDVRRAHARRLRQSALDAARARRTGHARYGQLDASGLDSAHTVGSFILRSR